MRCIKQTRMNNISGIVWEGEDGRSDRKQRSTHRPKANCFKVEKEHFIYIYIDALQKTKQVRYLDKGRNSEEGK